MLKPNSLTKTITITGTTFAWLPILISVGYTLFRYVRSGRFIVAFIGPAEFFPVALVGGILLLWAAIRMRTMRGLIAASLGAMVALFISMQAWAVASGLASGETGRDTWQWVLLMIMLGVYTLALVVLGVGGLRLTRIVFHLKRNK